MREIPLKKNSVCKSADAEMVFRLCTHTHTFWLICGIHASRGGRLPGPAKIFPKSAAWETTHPQLQQTLPLLSCGFKTSGILTGILIGLKGDCVSFLMAIQNAYKNNYFNNYLNK